MSRVQTITGKASVAGLTAALILASPTPIYASDAPQPFHAPGDGDSFDRALQCLTEENPRR
jgi:hypothetical protein